MAVPVEIITPVRGPRQPAPLSTEGSQQVNERGELLIAHGLPLLAEIVRYGDSYVSLQATAVAPLVALPTTTAQVSLWNGEPDGGKCYALDSLIVTAVVSAGAATPVGFAGMLNFGRVALPAGTLLTPKGLSGQAYRGRGKVILAATVVDDLWHPIGTSAFATTGHIGLNVDQTLSGQYLVPPGHLFSMAVLANTVTTITVKMGLRWHEVLLGVA